MTAIEPQKPRRSPATNGHASRRLAWSRPTLRRLEACKAENGIAFNPDSLTIS